MLAKLDARFKGQTIQDLGDLGIGEPHQGLELRASDAVEELEYHPDLIGKKKLLIDKLRGIGRIFEFPENAIGKIGEGDCYVRKGRSKIPISISSPPHIIVDASRRFAVYSDEFIAVPPRQVGINGTEESKRYLRALSLFLSSDFCTYHQFLHSPQWGIDASRADLNALTIIPAPLQRLDDAELQDWNDLLLRLRTGRSTDQIGFNSEPDNTERPSELLLELNTRVYNLLGLRQTEQWVIQDFVELHMQLNKGKFTPEVSRKPTNHEQLVYLKALRDCLDGFLPKDREAQHQLELLVDRESALLSVSLSKSKARLEPSIFAADDQASRDLKTIRDRLLTRHSQWIYFNRKLKVYEPKQGKLYQFKPLERLHWTRRQAVLDADDIIAETLVEAVSGTLVLLPQ